MPKTITLNPFIDHSREGEYFTLPFTVPPNIESLTLRYAYDRRPENVTQVSAGTFTARPEMNIIDLGLVAADGSQVGASGSDKTEITVSETFATPGYHPHSLVPGEWGIIVGAYKIASQGVTVTYELTFTEKQPRWLKGDIHAHTLASDGVLTAEELGLLALRNGLDYLAITDHNQPVSVDALPDIPGITLIPGLEWTLFRGHANFIGVEQPYDGPFFANTSEEIRTHFESAHKRGAFIMINHPFEEICPFQFDLNTLPFDALEVWNGPMRESNLRAIGLWQSMLAAGRKIPACGGSDYHRNTPFVFLGGPTTCVFSQSAGKTDILSALKQGHNYITFAPNGPSLQVTAGEAIMGDSVPWSQVKEMQIVADGLAKGDVVRVVTGKDETVLVQAPDPGRFEATYPMDAPGFARVEILRAFLPGLPMLPALISNPIYFDV